MLQDAACIQPWACESRTASATAIREKRQTTLPADVCEPLGIKPGDQVEWRAEGGEVRGKKLATQKVREARARLVKRSGVLIFEAPGVTISPDDIGQAIRRERDSR